MSVYLHHKHTARTMLVMLTSRARWERRSEFVFIMGMVVLMCHGGHGCSSGKFFAVNSSNHYYIILDKLLIDTAIELRI